MKIGLGQAEGIETGLETDSIITTCRKQIGPDQPKVGLVFASPHFDHVVMLGKICDAFPGMNLLGCTTSGNYTSASRFSDDSISLMVICDDGIEFGTGLGRDISIDYRQAVNQAYSNAHDALSNPPSLCLAFPHYESVMHDVMLDYLSAKLGRDCPVFGGFAGKPLTDDTGIYQFYNREVVSDTVPLLLVSGPMRYDFAIAHSWQPIGEKVEATKADGQLVQTIDGVSAVDFYRRFIGYHETPAGEFVLAVYEQEGRDFYIVSPIEYYHSGEIRFSGRVQEGSTVQLAEAIRGDLISDIRSTSSKLIEKDRRWTPACALTFSCGFRKEILGTMAREELNVLRDVFPPGLPITGIFSFGEFAPLRVGGYSKAHAATLIILLIGKDSVNGYHESPIESERKEATIYGSSSSRIDFLKRKYHRSEAYRQRLESLKESNSRMHRRIILDVIETRRKLQEKEEELKKSEEKFRRIVQTTGEGFILVDETLKIIDANDAFCKMVDLSRAGVIGSLFSEFLTEKSQHVVMSNEDRLLAGDTRKVEGALHSRSDRIIPILIHSNPLHNDQGEFIGQMAFFADMTEQKKALALAGEVLKSLLPRESPQVEGLDIAGRNVCCDEVGGDYFDFFLQNKGSINSFGVAVGDITGHGVDAALLMSSARAFLRIHVFQDNSLAEIVGSMNDNLAVDVMQSGRFMTLFYLNISSDLQSFEWVRAGHDPAILYDPATDEFTELMGPGMALGIEPGYRFKVNTMDGLHDGHLIAIGTDGLWESCNIDGEMFGKERFKALLRKYADRPVAEILNAVFFTLDEFRVGRKADDDITLVLVKVQKKTGPASIK